MKKLYKYKEKEYIELSRNCKIQIEGIWVDAVMYTNDSGIFFMRSVEEFDSKFELLKKEELVS